jgi:nicotinamidase-related amidase
MGSLELTVRYYRLYPYPARSFLGEAEKTLSLKADETAFVSVHCWNIDTPEGPKPIPEHTDCMGWTEAYARSIPITIERIKPAIEAARSASIPIVHVASPSYAYLYPQWPVLMKLSPPEQPEPGSVEGGKWHEEFTEEVFGKGYNEVWASMLEPDAQPKLDIAAVVKPLPQDYVVIHGTHLNRILRGLGIWNLIYVGFGTAECLMNSPSAMREMARFKYRCILLRDCTTALEDPDTVDQLLRTKMAIRQVEWDLGYTATSENFIAACRCAGGG